MTVARIVAQCIQKPCCDPQAAACLKLQGGSNTVHLTEFELQRLPAEQIGVLGQRLHGMRAESAVGSDRLLGGQTVAGKPCHDLPHTVHAAEFIGDDGSLLLGDALELAEALRRLGDDRQGVLSKAGDNFFCGGWSDIRQHTAGKIA